MPKVVLEGLKKHPVRISAISAMLDSGGSAGQERREYKTKVSFGDLRRAALALADISDKDKERFAYRYKTGPLEGHVIANTYFSGNMVGGEDLEDSLAELIEDVSDDLNISPDYKLVPATLDDSHLGAELEDGKIILGEGNIDVPRHDGKLKIKKAFLTPQAKAYSGALKEIKEADLIVIGPGDLYSSISQVLLLEGMAEAIRNSKAKKVFVCNSMTKNGETNDYSVADFVQKVEEMIGADIDHVIYNTATPTPEVLKKYKKNHEALISVVEANEDLPKDKFIGRSILKRGSLDHDSAKVSEILISLL